MDSSPYLTTDQFRKFFDTEFADLKQKYTSLMDQITQENTELKARVNDLTLENDQLKEQVNKLTANLNRGSSTTSSQTQNTPAFSTMASQWADEAKKQKVTQKQNKNIQNTQQKQYKTNQKTPKKKTFQTCHRRHDKLGIPRIYRKHRSYWIPIYSF
jgi:chemotaxis protein histidine kinase CheA